VTAHITAIVLLPPPPLLLLLRVMLKNCCSFPHRQCQLFYCTLADASSSYKWLAFKLATTKLAPTAGSFRCLLLWKTFCRL
jgi:hypothetical protein